MAPGAAARRQATAPEGRPAITQCHAPAAGNGPDHTIHDDRLRVERTHDPHDNLSWTELYAATTRIAYAELAELADEWWVTELAVHSDHRGHGLASRLLGLLLADHPGDQFGLSCEAFTPGVTGWPRTPGLPPEALAAFYARHRFVPTPDEDCPTRMTRLP